MPHPFTQKVIAVIRQIPAGKIATYGLVAACAGNPAAARQVARILHACSQKENLPWHRVVNRKGHIALKPFNGYALQKRRLRAEAIIFDGNDGIDLDTYLWLPRV